MIISPQEFSICEAYHHDNRIWHKNDFWENEQPSEVIDILQFRTGVWFLSRQCWLAKDATLPTCQFCAEYLGSVAMDMNGGRIGCNCFLSCCVDSVVIHHSHKVALFLVWFGWEQKFPAQSCLRGRERKSYCLAIVCLLSLPWQLRCQFICAAPEARTKWKAGFWFQGLFLESKGG